MNIEAILRLLEDYKPIEIIELLGLNDPEKLLEVLSDYITENNEVVTENLEINGVI